MAQNSICISLSYIIPNLCTETILRSEYNVKVLCVFRFGCISQLRVIGALYIVSNTHNLILLCCFYADSFIYLSLNRDIYAYYKNTTGAGLPARTAKCRAVLRSRFTPTTTRQSEKGIRGFRPIRERRVRGGSFPSVSEERH